MLEPSARLFVVQCRPKGGQITTLYVPALDADKAIARARAIAREAQANSPDIANPFENVIELEVRVGTIDLVGSKIVFDSWADFDEQ
jgi:hypothetical protein